MVDDRINQIQMARGMARIGEKLTLNLVLSKDDSLTEKIHDVLTEWEFDKDIRPNLFPIVAGSPWTMDVNFYAHCPSTEKDIQVALAYLRMFREELEGDFTLVKGGLMSFAQMVFPNRSEMEFNVEITVEYNENLAIHQRGVLY